MDDKRKAYLESEYQATYTEYVRCVSEYYRIEQGGGAITDAARQKLLMQLSTRQTNLYMRLCFLASIIK